MTTKTKVKRPILDAVLETARDLHSAGLIDKPGCTTTTHCVLLPSRRIPAKKSALRGRYNLSQSVLALVLNTSLSTVRQWEIGEKHPSGPSLKLLYLLDRKGLEVLT